MSNRDTQAAWDYHQGTNHSWESVHSGAHYLDWNNQPRPFKIYPQLEGRKLPTDLASSGMTALAALDSPGTYKTSKTSFTVSSDDVAPSLEALAGLLYYAAGITKRGIVPGGEMYFRAAACTGALFHIELYLVCGDLPGLAAGVYHFGPHDFSLRCLRQGDYTGALVEAAAGEPAVAESPATLVTTSVYWRNAWKYQARAYRHAYWDSGTILANLLATGNAYGLPLKVITAFVDEPVNRLLDLNTDSEAALQLVPVGKVPGRAVPQYAGFTLEGLETAPYSRREVDYPAMREMHAASSLASPEEVAEVGGSMTPAPPVPERLGPAFPLDPIPEEELPEEAIEQVILRRGSSRRFSRAPITYRQLSTTLDRAAGDLPADFLDEAGPTLNDVYLIVNEVEGIPPGTYFFNRGRRVLEQLKEGSFRDQAGHLGLDQELPADASVSVYFLSDLTRVLERYGNRGYRMAQVEASARGGRLYLAAYALRLGASGLTFYDDEVTEFFSPHAAGKSVMFLVALGRPLRRRRR